jgi:phage terminase large subunit
MEQRQPVDVLEFAAGLGIELYPWQADVNLTIAEAATRKRINIAVRAPNEAGKSTRIVAVSVLWHLLRFPRGRVVVTSRDNRQITDQFWSAVRRQLSKFPGWKITDSQHLIETPTGGRLRAFTTDDPGRAEGFHSEPDAPLLIIVDEAKSIEEEIFQAIDRCSYNALVYISSPSTKEGRFYQAFSDHADSFIQFHAGLVDCPHISKERIADTEKRYGPDHPFCESTLRGNFMEFSEGILHIIELSELELLARVLDRFYPASDRDCSLRFCLRGRRQCHSGSRRKQSAKDHYVERQRQRPRRWAIHCRNQRD